MGIQKLDHSDEALPAEIGQILDDIEQEPVPGRLLDLAVRLQAALQVKRRAGSEKAAAGLEA